MPAIPSRAFAVRPAAAEDAPAIASALSRLPDSSRLSGSEIAVLLQTGGAFLVAERDGRVCGAARTWTEEGIDWFDALVSLQPWAGRALLRGLEARAQDRGIRLVRARVPESDGCVEYLGRFGYMQVGHARDEAAGRLVIVERRVPLLTVREQRRSDAGILAQLTGGDRWDFERGVRPGWFVLSDGERFAGFAYLRDAGGGAGLVSDPHVEPGYQGRGLEVWMVERVALYAETNGYHTCRVRASPALVALERDLEDRGWMREGESFVRRARVESEHE